MQVPVLTSVTVAPATVQTGEVSEENATVSPEEADAATENGELASVLGARWKTSNRPSPSGSSTVVARTDPPVPDTVTPAEGASDRQSPPSAERLPGTCHATASPVAQVPTHR